jgi:hypothetical protein
MGVVVGVAFREPPLSEIPPELQGKKDLGPMFSLHVICFQPSIG